MHWIRALHLPSLDHVENLFKRFVGMRCSADEPTFIGTVADHDFVNDIFDSSTSRTNDSYYRNLIAQTLLNEIVE